MAVRTTRSRVELPASKGDGHALGFYAPAEASRIARIPQWTLNAWRRQGIVVPSVEWVDEQGKTHLGHTFETLVFLRLIRMLREEGIPLLKAVEAVKSLRRRFGPPGKKWARAKIIAERRNVYVHAEDDWETTLVPSHQKVATTLFGEEFRRLRDRADALLIPRRFMPYVEIDPAIRNGLPVVYDTSLMTSLIHNLRRQGYNYGGIVDLYPFMKRQNLMGAERYETFLDRETGTE